MTHISVKLSPATIKAQQKLSNKFGIATFNFKGGISTVPTSGKINTAINVGLGKFKSSKGLSVAINRFISARRVKKFTQSANRKKSGSIKKAPSVFNTSFLQSPSKKTPTVPKILSKSTLQAQQALSDKFGIPTFNLKGGISTVPISGIFQDINVGFGKFTDEDSFIGAVTDKFFESQEAPVLPTSSGGTVQQVFDFFSSLFQTEPQDTTTGTTIGDTGNLPDESSQTIQDEFLFGGSGGQSGDIQAGSENDEESFFDSILNNPVKLGLGIVILAVLATSLGGKKRRR